MSRTYLTAANFCDCGAMLDDVGDCWLCDDHCDCDPRREAELANEADVADEAQSEGH